MNHVVRLDMSKLLGGINKRYSLEIAESLLSICGLTQIKDEANGWRIFFVKTMPQDIEQAGIHWIEVDMPKLEHDHDIVTIFHGVNEG